MNHPKLKVGFMPTRRNNFSHEDAEKYKKMILSKVRELAPHCDIFDLEEVTETGLICSIDDAEKAARYFLGKEVDCLFIPHCSFGTEDAIAIAARKVGKPVLLWAPRDESPLPGGERLRDSQCGLFASSKIFHRFCIPFSHIVSSWVDSKVFEQGFLNFLRAAECVRRFRNARIGQLSTRPRAFCSVMMNEGELLERFGVQVVPREIGELAAEVRKEAAAPGKAVKERAAEMSRKVDFSHVSSDLPVKLAAFEHALLKWAADEQLDALAVQCWSHFQTELGCCPCFVHGELAELGLPTACETDIHGALTLLLVQSCTHFQSPAFFADLTIRHPENDNAELLWHCGVFPAALTKGAYSIERHYLLPGEEEGIGNCVLKDGDLTIARFDGIRGKYTLFCGEGKTVPGPFNKGTGVYIEVPDWPLWEEKLVQGPYIHHVAGTYGRFAPALCEATRFIDGLEFDPAQPTLEEIRKTLRESR